jgi:hypothetical protein
MPARLSTVRWWDTAENAVGKWGVISPKQRSPVASSSTMSSLRNPREILADAGGLYLRPDFWVHGCFLTVPWHLRFCAGAQSSGLPFRFSGFWHTGFLPCMV